MIPTDELHRRSDRWFIRRGLPQFVFDYRSDTDVWTRASPFLFITFFVLIVLGTLDADLFGAILLVGAAAVLLVGYAFLNVRRGRPFYSLPERVGPGFLIAYVAVPTGLSALATLSWQTPLATFVSALALLGISWVVTWIALIPLIIWAVRWTFLRLGDGVRVASRVLPLLLIFVTIIIFTTETWQVMGTLTPLWLWMTIALFLGTALVFIVGRVPAEIRELEAPPDRDSIVQACEGTPLGDVAARIDDFGPPVPLTRMQRVNAGVVITAAQAVQFALFGLVVWIFFTVVGVIAVSLPVQQLWMDGLGPVDVILQFGDDRVLSREGLRVATFIAGFSVLYAVVYSTTDGVYRQAFHDDIQRSMARAMSVRQAYLSYRADSPS